jgi:hypothetical protein
MSLVELKGIRCQKDQVILELGSLDLVDGTPGRHQTLSALCRSAAGCQRQLCAAGAAGGDAVSFTPETKQLSPGKALSALRRLCEVLAQDPRPAYRKEEEAGKPTPSGCWILTSAGA